MTYKLLWAVTVWCIAGALVVRGQALPKADDVIKQNLKAVGNTKRLAQTDRTYRYQVSDDQRLIGTAQLQLKQPSSLRLDVKTQNPATISAMRRLSEFVTVEKFKISVRWLDVKHTFSLQKWQR